MTSAPTVSASPAAEPVQRIDGSVWLDLDRDGQRDAGEAGLPAVTVELVRADQAALLSADRGAAVRAAAVLRTTRTGADGAFAFTGIPAGDYQVLAQRPAELSVTWDSQGVPDARALVALAPAGEGYAAVGLVGDAGLEVPVQDDAGPVTGPVELQWAGPDGRFGSADDVLLSGRSVAGHLSLAGLPAGAWRVRRVGGSFASALRLVPHVTQRTVVRLPAAAVDAAGTLPRTGAPGASSGAAALGASLLLAGALLLAVGRPVRRRR
ncbi:MAG: SdrD B-like domain-containing protein [Motilibacteraceae bacterium]